ncbi:hypothetical protein CUJ84_pRLN1000579 (plasmid) [Rhizobium leguminosarum]|uniref:Uncharacterized protein n=1 Tax=Rhizobium leguminosarum TaxID=384 RepID=A0A2K9ZCU4_RHILE|nr:hypothetical protein CUJ84_pRLN1000579 [Rhizobium leguminosarum]
MGSWCLSDIVMHPKSFNLPTRSIRVDSKSPIIFSVIARHGENLFSGLGHYALCKPSCRDVLRD